MDAVLWTLRLKAIGANFVQTVKMDANSTGQQLFDLVAKEGGFAPNSFKLMCSGRYVIFLIL